MKRFTDEQIVRAASMSPLKYLPPNTKTYPRGKNGWMAQCPFHNDRTPSLSITKCEDGRHRYFCHGCGEKGDTIKLVQMTRNMTFESAVSMLINEAKTAPLKPEIVETYPYRDEKGQLLFEIVRYSPKSFRVRTPLPNGMFCWRRPQRTVLYNLDMLHSMRGSTEPIYLVEGEKDANAIMNEQNNGHATTWPFGATAWNDSYAKQLIGLKVVVVPDRDPAGLSAGRRVWAALKKEKLIVARGSVVLPEGTKDVSDYFQLGKTLRDLETLIRWEK